MIEETLPGIHRIEVPLPGSPLQFVNSYLIKGEGKDLLIDTGMNIEECRRVLWSALQLLGADLANLNIFITHLHYDHFGLALPLSSKGSTIYINAPDALFLGDPGLRQKALTYGRLYGFLEDELQMALEKRNAWLTKLPIKEIKWALEHADDGIGKNRFKIMGEGDILNAGPYLFQCLMTPGHSNGHLCLYEHQKKILFSGDHILEEITSAICLWPGEKHNPLYDYLQSLDKISNLDVATILPGHRKVFNDCRGRISQIKTHHRERNKEIVSCLRDEEINAFQIASRIKWDISLPWAQFAPELKWIAFAETLAHLKYLEEKGQIRGQLKGDTISYHCLS